MSHPSISTLLAASLWMACAAHAQTTPAPLPPADAAPTTLQRGGEAAVVDSTVEDDSIRIHDVRVRGESKRLVVSSKQGAPTYEIVPADGGRDLSKARGAVGQRVWSVLSF